MAWIEVIERARAQGLLARLYDEAIRRAGRLYAVLAVQGQQPKVMQASTMLYTRAMHGPDEPLTRAQREMIAVVVSRENRCEY